MIVFSTKAILGAAIVSAAVFVAIVPSASANQLKLASFLSPAHHLNTVVFAKLIKDFAAATDGSTA